MLVQQSWSAEETERAKALKAAGLTYSQVAERLNRTLWGVRAHLDRSKRSAEELRERERRRPARLRVSRRHDEYDGPIEAPEWVLAARDRRMAAPWRSLGDYITGCPRYGYSELDRRMKIPAPRGPERSAIFP